MTEQCHRLCKPEERRFLSGTDPLVKARSITLDAFFRFGLKSPKLDKKDIKLENGNHRNEKDVSSCHLELVA